MIVYPFPGTDREHLPHCDSSVLENFHHVVRLLTAQLIPSGAQLKLCLGVSLGDHNSVHGIASVGGAWMPEVEQLRLMQMVSFLSGVSRFRYDRKSALKAFYHQAPTAHELIEIRGELSDICAKRGLSWARISQKYDQLPTRQPL